MNVKKMTSDSNECIITLRKAFVGQFLITMDEEKPHHITLLLSLIL